MKKLIQSGLVLLGLTILPNITLAQEASSDDAQKMNFSDTIQAIQDSMWKGSFRVNGLGPLTNCSGPLSVEFFPLTVESFSDGIPTISYRHHADFSMNRNPICKYIASKLSPVAVGTCTDIFPMKFSRRENADVPFRTIIPRDEGRVAFVSSPSCNKSKHLVERQELALTKALLSEQGNRLELEIDLRLAGQLFRLTYDLVRQVH